MQEESCSRVLVHLNLMREMLNMGAVSQKELLELCLILSRYYSSCLGYIILLIRCKLRCSHLCTVTQLLSTHSGRVNSLEDNDSKCEKEHSCPVMVGCYVNYKQATLTLRQFYQKEKFCKLGVALGFKW